MPRRSKPPSPASAGRIPAAAGDCAAHNLQRLMAARGWSVDEVAARTNLDRRTIYGILQGAAKPHARTLKLLADGLDVSTDELFLDPSRLLYRNFDRDTNPVVQEVLESHGELFADWSAADFDELHSRVGTGGALTREGALQAVRQMNRKRELIDKLSLLLETSQAEVIGGILDLLYEKTVIAPP